MLGKVKSRALYEMIIILYEIYAGAIRHLLEGLSGIS